MEIKNGLHLTCLNLLNKIMKATKDHISLETAKMLKNCGIEGKYFFCRLRSGSHVPLSECIWSDLSFELGKSYFIEDGENIFYRDDRENPREAENIPAFTWQEILWEYEEKLFEGGEIVKHTQKILLMIQAKLYKKADEYFREHCILIKK